MKKATRITVLLCCIVLLVGMVIMAVGFALGGTWIGLANSAAGWGWLRYNINLSTNGQVKVQTGGNASGTILPETDITGLSVSGGVLTVTVKTGSEYALTADDDVQFTSAVEDGVWTVKATPNTSRNDAQSIEITVPEGMALDTLKLEIGAGKLEVQAKELPVKNLTVDCGAGHAKLQNVMCTQGGMLQVGAGSLELSGALQGKVSIDCGMGNVQLKIEEPQTYGYEVNLGLGVVQLFGNQWAGMAGDVNVNTDADTVYTIDCGMGRVNVEKA